MLLTLTANALRARIVAPGRKPAARSRATEAVSPEGSLQITDLPRFAREELGLFGLNLSTKLLIGADLKRIDSIRDAADKSSCPVLTLVESETQPMGTTDDALGDAAIARAHRVVQAAHRLGCSSVGLAVSCKDNEDEIDFCIERLRRGEQAGVGVSPLYVQRTAAELKYEESGGISPVLLRQERVAKKMTARAAAVRAQSGDRRAARGKGKSGL